MGPSNILLIGGWEKNAGKTTLTTRLISELTKKGYTIISIKVTVLRGFNGTKGFTIWEEYDADRQKDTGRMLKAGAEKVFWLKTDEEHVLEGINALAERIPGHACVLCESNILRDYITPGMFIMVKRDHPVGMKKSALAVQNNVDLFVTTALDNRGLSYTPGIPELMEKITELWGAPGNSPEGKV